MTDRATAAAIYADRSGAAPGIDRAAPPSETRDIYAGRPGGGPHYSGVDRPATPSEELEAKAAAKPVKGSRLLASADPVDWGFAAIRDKLLGWRDIRNDRHAAVLRISDERSETTLALQKAEIRLAQLLDNKISVGEEHPALIDARAQVEKFKTDFSRLDRRYEQAAAGWQEPARLEENCTRYLQRVGVDAIEFIEFQPQLLNGEQPLDAIERAQRRKRELKADRADILARPIKTSVAKQLARQQLAKRVEAAKPNVFPLIELGEPVEFPHTREALQSFGVPGAVNLIDPVGLLAWMFPKEFALAIDREIDTAGDDAQALTDDDRRGKLKQIDGDLLASQRQEAYFCELAGLLPSSDIDPRAALGLVDEAPAPREIGER